MKGSYISEAKWRGAIEALRSNKARELSEAKEYYFDLGGIKTVRMVVTDPDADALIRRELGWITVTPVIKTDATIVLLREDDIEGFFGKNMGLNYEWDGEERFSVFNILTPDAKVYPSAQINRDDQTIHIADGNTYYYVTRSYRPEDWIQEGHVCVQMFFRIMNTMPSAGLVHGACVGLDGKGVLMCARGNRGKSSLAVSAMLEGFEYVSEDYLILEKDDPGKLFASPVYSIVTLSPRMFNTLYDDMPKARFVGISHFKGKYVFDISAYSDRLRYHYPVKACIFPEIDLNATNPVVSQIDGPLKNRAITHVAQSTIFQMWSGGLKQGQKDTESILKIINLVRDMDFYKIVLTPDIRANAACLRNFVSKLK